MAVLVVGCCTWAFFSCGEWALVSSCGARTSCVVKHMGSTCTGFSGCSRWAQ